MPASSTTMTARAGSSSGAGAQGGEQRRDARARDPAVVLELPCCAPSDRSAEDGEPGRLPRLTRRSERERLTGARLARHDIDASPSRHSRRTISRCSPARLGRARSARRDRVRSAMPAPAFAAALHRADEPLLDGEQLRRGVAQLVPKDWKQPPVPPADTPPRSALCAINGTTREEARNRSVAASSVAAVTRVPGGSTLADLLDYVSARERRSPVRQARSANRARSNTRCHVLAFGTVDRARAPVVRPRPRTQAPPPAHATRPRASPPSRPGPSLGASRAPPLRPLARSSSRARRARPRSPPVAG